jgi:hypothetical protein
MFFPVQQRKAPPQHDKQDQCLDGNGKARVVAVVGQGLEVGSFRRFDDKLLKDHILSIYTGTVVTQLANSSFIFSWVIYTIIAGDTCHFAAPVLPEAGKHLRRDLEINHQEISFQAGSQREQSVQPRLGVGHGS